MTTPIDRAFNAIIRKTTLPAQELLFVLRQLADEVAAEEFASVMTTTEAAAAWLVQPGTAHYRIRQLHQRSNGHVGRLLHGRTWIIRQRDVEQNHDPY